MRIFLSNTTDRMPRRMLGLLLMFLFVACASGQPASNHNEPELRDIPYRALDEKLDDYARQRCRLDLHVPPDTKDFPTIVWFHGGALKKGNKAIPEELRGKGIAVAAVNYRLSPKAKHPAYIEDAAAAVAWVFKHIAKYGGDPKKIIVAGHSAGGYLALMVALDKSYLAKHGIDADTIAAVFPYSGQCLTHYTIRDELGLGHNQGYADRFAPIYHVRKGLPPMVLTTGDRDKEQTGRYEENALLSTMLKKAGNKKVELHEFKGSKHGTMTKPAHKLTLERIEGMFGKP